MSALREAQPRKDTTRRPRRAAGVQVRTLFLSDIHLGYRHARVDELNEFMGQVEAERIVLVGDIVDAWSLARRAFWSPGHTQVVRTLLARQRAGVRLIYIPGNHDASLAMLAQMLQRAVDLRPNDGYIVDSLGWAHFKLGHYEEAARLLEKAIELKPADPVVNDHLGDAYWRMGRKLDAHFQWNHARDMGPEPEDLPRILKKIESGLPDEPEPAAAQAEPKKDGG